MLDMHVMAGFKAMLNSDFFLTISDTVIIGSWFLLIIVYISRFKKAVLAGLFLISIPLFISSLVEFMALVWPFGWWLMATLKSFRRKEISEKQLDFEPSFNYFVYLLSIAGLYFIVGSSYEVPQFITALYFGGPDIGTDIPAKYALLLGRLSDGFQIATFLLFSYLLARHGRTFVEDIAKIAVVRKDGAKLSFIRALARYLLMFATFPLGFGLINFLFKEPLYNKWTGAVEYRNEKQAIKDGWVYRNVTGAGKKADETKTS